MKGNRCLTDVFVWVQQPDEENERVNLLTWRVFDENKEEGTVDELAMHIGESILKNVVKSLQKYDSKNKDAFRPDEGIRFLLASDSIEAKQQEATRHLVLQWDSLSKV